MSKKKELVEKLKADIISQDYPTYEYPDYPGRIGGTLYLKEKMDYGFHIYHIIEPDPNIPLSGQYGTVTELYYDLRNKEYWVKRNDKEVKFSERNVDSIFSSKDKEVFEFLSTKNNKGLYQWAYTKLGALDGEYVRKVGRFFYRLITEYSYYELFYKVGLQHDIPPHYYVNHNGTSPREVLGLSKTQWKMYTKFGISISTLRDYRGYRNPSADNKAINFLSYVRSLEDEFGIDKVRAFVQREFYCIYEENQEDDRSMVSLCRRYNLPIKRVIRYIYFECDVSQALKAHSATQLYGDYIRMCHDLDYKGFDRYPSYLHTQHDIVSRNYNIKLDEMELKEWAREVEKAKKYEYQYKEYTLFPPDEPSDLVTEGNELVHCVGSYIGKVRKGTSTILFLRTRKEKDVPLVTVEVREGKIVQARGKRNRITTPEEADILQKFAKNKELEITCTVGRG